MNVPGDDYNEVDENDNHDSRSLMDHVPRIHFSEHKLRCFKFLILFVSFMLRYQQLFYIVCRRCSTDRLLERTYVIQTQTCPKDSFTKFQHWSNGHDPRTYSPMRTVYIKHDRVHKLVFITAEDAVKSLEDQMIKHSKGIIANKGYNKELGRREDVPCKDLHTLGSIPETRMKQKEKEEESWLFAFASKFAQASQDFTAYMFDCEKNGFDENYTASTHDLFCVFLLLALAMFVI